MGFKRWSSSKLGTQSVSTNSFANPNPKNYRILRSEYKNGNTILELRYLDCTNYEGKKILLFKGKTLSDILITNNSDIDPHFNNNPKYVSPFARFEPTDEGWALAIKLAESM